MKKSITLLLLILGVFLCFSSSVKPLLIDYKVSFNNGVEINFFEGDEISAASCDGLFTAEALDLISEILGYFKILGPVALIIFTAIDFGGAVLSQDNDMVKKATSKVIKRALATIGLFLVPAMIQIVVNLPGVRDTIQIPSDPLCGTALSHVDESSVLVR